MNKLYSFFFALMLGTAIFIALNASFILFTLIFGLFVKMMSVLRTTPLFGLYIAAWAVTVLVAFVIIKKIHKEL